MFEATGWELSLELDLHTVKIVGVRIEIKMLHDRAGIDYLIVHHLKLIQSGILQIMFIFQA